MANRFSNSLEHLRHLSPWLHSLQCIYPESRLCCTNQVGLLVFGTIFVRFWGESWGCQIQNNCKSNYWYNNLSIIMLLYCEGSSMYDASTQKLGSLPPSPVYMHLIWSNPAPPPPPKCGRPHFIKKIECYSFYKLLLYFSQCINQAFLFSYQNTLLIIILLSAGVVVAAAQLIYFFSLLIYY